MVDREKIKKLVKDILGANVEEKVEILKDFKGDREPQTSAGKELQASREFLDELISEFCREGNIDRASLGTVVAAAAVEEDPNAMYKIRVVKVKKPDQSMARTFVVLSRIAKTAFPPGVGSTLIKKEGVAGLFESPIKPMDIDYSMSKAEALTASKEFEAIELEVTLVKA
jgi:hypothetical protein